MRSAGGARVAVGGLAARRGVAFVASCHRAVVVVIAGAGSIHIRQLPLRPSIGLGRGVGLVGNLVDVCLEGRADGVAVRRRQRPVGEQLLLEPRNRIFGGPFLEQVRGHVGDARRLLVAAHAEGHELQERGALAGAGAGRRPRDGVDDGEDVVAVDGLGGDAVAGPLVRQPRAGVLLADGRRQAVHGCSRRRTAPGASTRRPGSPPRGSRPPRSRRRR